MKCITTTKKWWRINLILIKNVIYIFHITFCQLFSAIKTQELIHFAIALVFLFIFLVLYAYHLGLHVIGIYQMCACCMMIRGWMKMEDNLWEMEFLWTYILLDNIFYCFFIFININFLFDIFDPFKLLPLAYNQISWDTRFRIGIRMTSFHLFQAKRHHAYVDEWENWIFLVNFDAVYHIV